MKVPVPHPDAVKAALDELAPRNPKAQNQDPKKFFNDAFVRELETSGYIERLYR
jgi:hypothetical protein